MTISASAATILHLVALIASVGFAVSVLEDLTTYHQFDRYGLLDWQVSRLRQKWTSVGPLASIFDFILASQRWKFVLISALIASVLMPMTIIWNSLLAPFTCILLLSTVLISIRSLYGLDGADQMNLVIFSAVFAGSLSADGSFSQHLALGFVAVQTTLAYTIAGVAKLVSPAWRTGQALLGILSTDHYGHKWANKFLHCHRKFNWILSWAVIIFECFSFLVFLVPGEIVVCILIGGLLFHALCAVLMGLNDFFWAFMASYPAVYFVTQTSV